MARNFLGQSSGQSGANKSHIAWIGARSFSAVSAFVWLQCVGVTATWNARVLSNSHTDADNNGFQFRAVFIGGAPPTRFQLITDVGSGTTFVSASSSGTYSTPGGNSVWFPMGFTYDGTTVRNYINGAQDGTATITGPMTSGGLPIWISGDPAYVDDFFDGNIADAAVWTVALTAFEMAVLANGIRPGQIRPASLLSWLPIDGDKSPEPDLSGNGNNGTLLGNGLAKAFGPPFAPFTPRWPQTLPPPPPPPPPLGIIGLASAEY